MFTHSLLWEGMYELYPGPGGASRSRSASSTDSHYFKVSSPWLKCALSPLWCLEQGPCWVLGSHLSTFEPHPSRGFKVSPELSFPLSRYVLKQHFPRKVPENSVFHSQMNLENSAPWRLPKHFITSKAWEILHKETNLVFFSHYFKNVWEHRIILSYDIIEIHLENSKIWFLSCPQPIRFPWA